jgi:trehalose/maltose hydrolase-like predicted phosphorylase
LAMRFFRRTLEADSADVQGGTTAEGIHTGAMAGAVLWVLEEFAGLDLRGAEPLVRPALPAHVRRITFRCQHRGSRHRFVVGPTPPRSRA